MSRTSRKNFSETLRNKIWERFWNEIEKSKKTGPADSLLRFLTDEERAMFEKRLATIYFLEQGESLRETSKKADVTKKTVIFVKRGLKPLKYKKRVYSKFSSFNKKKKF